MARGVNKVILIGNLGKDPEVRYSPSGAAVAKVTIATSDSWKDKQTGELQERTEWHNVVFFSRLAEIVGEYLRKGSKVYIEGRLQTSKWQGQDGNDRYTTEIVANEMQMLDSRGGGSASFEPRRPQQQSNPPAQKAPAPNPPLQEAPAPKPAAQQGAGSSFDNDFDDDIPF